MTTKTEILIEAMRQLAESIDSVDGVANAAISEAAQRLDDLQTALQSVHSNLVSARNERDEARAEVERVVELMKSNATDRLAKLNTAWKQYDEARAELENLREVNAELREDEKRLVRDRDFAQAEAHRLQICIAGVRDQRNKAYAEVVQLKDAVAAYEQATVKQSLTVRPEPSRLEIAAMLMTSSMHPTGGATSTIGERMEWAIAVADALIAAAKEAK